jgi:tetratricopeptide (TPR) repeat protein
MNAQATGASALRWADSLRQVIDRATVLGDTAVLRGAIRLADRVLRAMPDHGLLLHYRGYASYRLAQPMAEGDERDVLLEEALATLPETAALRASVMGQLMAGSVLRGMRYGVTSSRAESMALSGPPNPRALLLVAINSWYKPAVFGGGERKARTLLDRALQAFPTDRPRDGYPTWGAAEAQAWLGIMEQRAGRALAARAAFEKALALEPGYQWVRATLLPSLR